MNILNLIISFGLPTAMTGFFFWLLERRIDKKEKEEQKREEERLKKEEEQEKSRENYQLYLIKSVGAAIALGEATAKAVGRIPDAKCNGDMHAALEYATKVKHEEKDFLTKQSVEALQN